MPGREPLQTCSRCKRRRPYNRKEGWRGNICGRCQQAFRDKAEVNAKARIAEWWANATPVKCNTCHETKAYGVGWDRRRCPQCQAVRAAAKYAEVTADPERFAHRKAKQEEARRQREKRRKVAANSQLTGKKSGQLSNKLVPKLPKR